MFDPATDRRVREAINQLIKIGEALQRSGFTVQAGQGFTGLLVKSKPGVLTSVTEWRVALVTRVGESGTESPAFELRGPVQETRFLSVPLSVTQIVGAIESQAQVRISMRSVFDALSQHFDMDRPVLPVAS